MTQLLVENAAHPKLRCPSCGADLGEIPITPQKAIRCAQCAYSIDWEGDCWDACVDKTYPRDFARQWVLWEEGKLGDRNLVYGNDPKEYFRELLASTSLTGEDLKSMRIIEIGYGHGRLLREIQRWSPQAYGLDLARPLQSAQLSPGSVVFGNLLNNPFAPRQFDLVICRGVIHLTGDPQKSFDCLAEQVAPGGMLFIGGLYEPGKGDLIFRKIFPRVWKYPEWMRLGISHFFTPFRAALEAIRTRKFGLKDFRRFCRHYPLDIFDAISPTWTFSLTEDDVLPMYSAQGFQARKVGYGAYFGIKTA